MTDRQALRKLLRAESYLKATQAGYAPDRPNWKAGMPLLWEVRMALKPTAAGLALAEAHGILKSTEHGYDPRARRWKDAMFLIDSVEAELAPPPVPLLGPVVPGGKPILLEAPTHNTDGLFGSPLSPDPASEYPAFDFGWAAGITVLAPEGWEVQQQSGAMGADAYYAVGDSGILFWLGHIVSAPSDGTRIEKGKRAGVIAAIPGADHGHLGVDVRPLLGRDLRWGRNGNGPDYTWGAPTIGQQLTKGLAL